MTTTTVGQYDETPSTFVDGERRALRLDIKALDIRALDIGVRSIVMQETSLTSELIDASVEWREVIG